MVSTTNPTVEGGRAPMVPEIKKYIDDMGTLVFPGGTTSAEESSENLGGTGEQSVSCYSVTLCTAYSS